MKTHIALVLDESASMNENGKKQDALNFAQQFIKDSGDEVDFTFILFNGIVRTVKEISEKTYKPNGSTALFDAVGVAIENLEGKKADRFLVNVITDGQENTSQVWNKNSLKKKLAAVDKKDNWTVVFQLPPGQSQFFHNQFGIPLDNLREWEKISQISESTTQSLRNYLSSDSLKTHSFYVKTHVDIQEVKENLVNVADKYKRLVVKDEVPIKDFFLQNGMSYNPKDGKGFYQLLKPEKIQSYKEILVWERGKPEIYGGRQARQVIGLPQADAKVTPAHLKKFDIFVQSTSVNRKLPKGSLLLVKQ